VTDTTEAPDPVIDFVPVERVRDGKPVTEELLVRFQPAFGPLPACLSIGAEWSERRQEFRRYDAYDVESCPSALGRAFRLVRAPEAVEKDPDHEPEYWVLIAGPKDTHCQCKGFQAVELKDRVCKHVTVLRWLISEKHI
jgi:hypothetical protein